MFIICYDVAEDKIRRRVVQYLETFSYRIQGSVFICSNPSIKMHAIAMDLMRITAASVRRRLLVAPLGGGRLEDVWTDQGGLPQLTGKTYFIA